jgi:hypothetical protein
MINLVGWAVGNALAREAKASTDEVARLSLLGAASPSPLLGAILVRSALDRDDRGVTTIGADDGDSDSGSGSGRGGGSGGGADGGGVDTTAGTGSDVILEREKELTEALDEYNAARAERASRPEAFGTAAAHAREHLDALSKAISDDQIRPSSAS